MSATTCLIQFFVQPLDRLVDLLWPPCRRSDGVEADIEAARHRS